MSPRTLVLLSLGVLLAGCPRGPGDDTSDDTADDTGDTSDTDTGTDTSDTDTDTGTDTSDTDTGTAAIDCHTLPTTLPAWAGDITPTTLVTATPYDFTATGLSALVDAIAALPNNTTTTPNVLTTPITVTDAIVLTTGFKPSSATNEVNFWVADKDDVIYLRLAVASSVVVKSGDKVTFTATHGQNYEGDIQVATLSSFSVTSSGNPVYVKESNASTLALADAYWVHHMYGELTDVGTLCGPSTCFTYRHGGASGPTSTLRIRNDNLSIPLVKGDCIEVYMPADQFSGGITMDVSDFSWQRWYGNSGN